MKKLVVILAFNSAMSVLCGQQVYKYPFQNPGLPDEERITNLISLMTFDEKVNMYAGAGCPRLNVAGAGSTEAIHGIVQGGPGWGQNQAMQITTSFPQGYGLGETWDTELMQRFGDHLAYEARFLYQSPRYKRAGLILWSPNADLGRDIRWGRTEECYGEDPYLVGELSTAQIKGMQGSHPRYWKSASLMKHFLANSNESGRTETSSEFDDALFHDYYALGFKKGICEGGANAIMTAYNAYNGIPCTIHPVLRSILMNDWNFNGLIITDGGAFQQLKNTHKVFADIDSAAQACIHAGTTRFLDNYRDALVGAVHRNMISEQELDENIKGNLRVMLKLGMLDDSDENPYKWIGVRDTVAPWNKPETKELVRLVANKSGVLLKNDRKLLPLQKERIRKIAVIGNRADKVLQDWYGGKMPYTVTPLEGIRNAVQPQGIEVRYVEDDKRGEAQRLAEWADVAIVCVGNEPTCSPDWAKSPWGKGVIAGEGREDVDRTSIQLEQEDLIKMVYKANPNTVAVLISSFPYAINWTQQHVPAILHLTQSCQELGNSVADLLFGAYNPAGRTTQTWVSSIDELPNMLDYDIRKGRTYMYYTGKPLYPFGHGLSYTTFSYSNLQTSANTLKGEEDIVVSVDLTNTGEYDGEEVVQLYVKMNNDDAAKRLRGFKRVFLKKGEKKRIEIPLKSSDLALWNPVSGKSEVSKGPLKLMVGTSSEHIKHQKTIRVL